MSIIKMIDSNDDQGNSPEYNYKEDIKIHPGRLEEDICNHAELFMKYAELYAIAVQEKDRQKQRLDLMYVELDAEVRANWQSYFSKRPTETQIKTWILVHPRYIKAQGLYSKACYNVNITAGAKDAFSQRRYMISNAVSMKIGGIFANPQEEKSSKPQEFQERKRVFKRS